MSTKSAERDDAEPALRADEAQVDPVANAGIASDRAAKSKMKGKKRKRRRTWRVATLREVDLFRRLRSDGYSLREIALATGFHASTISRASRRGTVRPGRRIISSSLITRCEDRDE